AQDRRLRHFRAGTGRSAATRTGFHIMTASRRAFVATLALGLLLPAGGAFATTRTLRGTVSYRERIALPPGAIVEVKLLDVSLADAPARIIAETRVSGARNPARYVLHFDRTQIQPRRRYALQ